MNKFGAVFSGQGTQYHGMGRSICQKYKIADDIFNHANEILGMNIKNIMFSGDERELNNTSTTQPAVLLYSFALFKIFEQEYDIRPTVFAGHSLGEYTALTCAGAIPFDTALKMVKLRGNLMDNCSVKGSMAAVIGGHIDDLLEYCEKYSDEEHILTVSNYNSSNQSVLSGDKNLVKDAAEYFETQGLSTKQLNVSGAFHSPMMKSAQSELEKAINNCEFIFPDNKVISNIDGRPYTNVEDIKCKLVKQLTLPVKWVDVMKYFSKEQINTVIEFGPKNTLSKFFLNDGFKLRTFSIDIKEDCDKLKNFDDNKETKVEQLEELRDRCLSIVACTHNYNQNSVDYEKEVILPCRELREKSYFFYSAEEYESEAKQLLKTLLCILVIKGIPDYEIDSRMQILGANCNSSLLYKVICEVISERNIL